jgi:uncharacterized delta-60 repeat protein
MRSISMKFRYFSPFEFMAIFLILIASGHAQVQQAWVRRFENSPVDGDDNANAMVLDSQENIYVAGYVTQSGSNKDAILIKYDPQGVELWTATYNGPGNFTDEAYAIAVDAQDNVYIAGVSIGNGTATDYFTIKYNSAGTQQWIARYNGTGNAADECYSIAVDSGSNVVITGFSKGSGTNYDYATVKYDSSGNELWVARYDASSNFDWGQKVKIGEQGAIHVSGSAIVTGVGEVYQTLKYSLDGDLLWTARYNSVLFGNDQMLDMTIDSQENIYVAGQSDANSGTSFDFATVKYDSAGNQLWVARYNGSTNLLDSPRSIEVDDVGNVYVAGLSNDANNYSCYVTIKYDSSGNQLWIKTYDSPGNNNDQVNDLALDEEKNVYITGSAVPPNGTSIDYYTIKYDSLGNEQWAMSYDGPAAQTDNPSTLKLDSMNNIYVTGYTRDTGNETDITTIKYAQQPQAVRPPNESGISPDFQLAQNYPNPFNPVTQIRFQLPEASQVEIKVYNTLGQEVAVLLNERKPAGTYEVDFNGSKLSSGIYLYKLQADDFTETRKMILMR